MTIKEYKHSKKSENKIIKNIIKIIVVIIMVSVIYLITNTNNSFKSFIKNKVFKSSINFASINNYYNKYVTSVFKNDEEISIPVVNTNINEYVTYKDGVEVRNNDSEVYNLDSGIVLYIGEIEDYGYGVTIEQSNGIDVTYAGLDRVDLKLYDYIKKGTIIGSKKDKYYLTFSKNGEYLDYKDYIK